MKPKHRYRCKALYGESSYNICINSDMTVSCNCADYFGRGQIGNLKENSLKDIFAGDKARHLRKSLFNGKLPIPECQGCPELEEIGEDEDKSILETFLPPKNGIMVENTVVCNLGCLSCNRIDLMKTRKSKAMSLEDMKLVAEVVSENRIPLVHYFNLGEPFLSKRVYQELQILRNANEGLTINTSTHGMFLDTPEKIEGALLLNHIFFSIDGSDQETVVKYQVGANFEKSYRNMARLVTVKAERGLTSPIIEWKYVVFPWNSDGSQIQKAIKLAREAKVDIISFFRGGGVGSLTPNQFTDLPSLKNVGFESWRGKEIVINEEPNEAFNGLIADWSNSIAENSSSKVEGNIASKILFSIENSKELNNLDFVRRTYRTLLQREPDKIGYHNYIEELGKGAKREIVIQSFLESEEFRALHC